MNWTAKLPSPLLLVVLSLLFATPASSSAGQAEIPEKLPDALKGSRILDTYTPAEGFDRAGVVHALQGTVVVMHRADQRAFVASKGDPVHENDELFTLADSRCRIRFLSEDVVATPEKPRGSTSTVPQRMWMHFRALSPATSISEAVRYRTSPSTRAAEATASSSTTAAARSTTRHST